MHSWDTPRYTAAEAGRLVGLSADRVRRWLKGYEYDYQPAGAQEPHRVVQGPVIQQEGARQSSYASFLDLIDLLFLRRFLDAGLSLQKVRKALEEANALIGGHHFAHRAFFTDGRELYLRVRDKDADNLLQLLSGGQWVIAEVILQFANQIDFDAGTGFAEKWYPEGRQGRIVLDPRIAFGAPTIIGTGVRTANVYDLFLAEEKKAGEVASWMRLEPGDVHAAVEFEQALAA